MSVDEITLDSLEESVRKQVNGRFGEILKSADEYGILREIADSTVPTLYSDLWNIARDNSDIGEREPEIYSGRPTPIFIITENIIEHLVEIASDEFEGLKEEIAEELESS
jgi:hypothetical protein